MTDHAMDIGVPTGQAFIDAIVAHDWDRLAACFAPEGRFLAVVAHDEHPFRERIGGTAAAEQISRWFDIADETILLRSEVEPRADRVRIVYRIRQHEPDGWYLVEQLVYATPDDKGFGRVSLACSGFRPLSDDGPG